MIDEKVTKNKAKLAKISSLLYKEQQDQTYGSLTIKLEAGQIVAVAINRNVKMDA